MSRTARTVAAGILTLGIAAGGATLVAAPASAAPTYSSPSTGCNDKPGEENDEYVKGGPPTPDGYTENLVKCVGNTALAAWPGAGWAGRAALGAWAGWNSCGDLGG